VSRDAVFAALSVLLQGIPGVVTFSRRLKHWSDVDPLEQPALFLAGAAKAPRQDKSGLPVIWALQGNLYLYVHNTDPDIAPSTKLNDLLDAIEARMAPAFPGQKQTLGGLCQHCWISGPIETDEGILGDQAMAIIPFEIFLA